MSAKRPPWWPTLEQKARAQLSTKPGLGVLGDAGPETLLLAYNRLMTQILTSSERSDQPSLPDAREQAKLLHAEILRRMT